MNYDAIICGGGAAGSVCAAFCAAGGLRTLVLEKAVFPRDKVCGDCINPSCWPVLERLEVAGRVLALPHSRLSEIEFIGVNGRSIKYPLHPSERGEIAVKRSVFDELLLQRAVECGAEVRQNTTVTAIERKRLESPCRGREFSLRIVWSLPMAATPPSCVCLACFLRLRENGWHSRHTSPLRLVLESEWYSTF